MQRRWFAAILLLVSLIGCGKSGPEIAPTSGTVTLNGQPVEGAVVVFMPTGGRPANGQTDAAGRFQLTTTKTGDGAIVGDHRVSIQKMVKTGSRGGYDTMENVLPARYADVTKSGLTAKVASPGPNDFPFDLKGAK